MSIALGAKSKALVIVPENGMKEKLKFRFEDFDIWKQAVLISDDLFAIASDLETMKKYRFSEQLNAATLSITNNIAEGSGSVSDKDFAHFLNISRRSVFECANMIAILERNGMVESEKKVVLFDQLDHLSSMITNFRKRLIR